VQREFESFLQENPQWNSTTRAIYLGWSKTYQTFLSNRDLSWLAARRTDLEGFQQLLLWTPNGHGGLQSGNTIYQGLRLLRAFYAWAVKCELLSASPMEGWCLPRPPSHPRRPLTWEETQQLFRTPNLGQPQGHRDLLLLHLIYQGVSISHCRRVTIDSEVPGDDTLQAVRGRYLSRARPSLVGDLAHIYLLVTDNGLPFGSNTGISLRLKRYRPDLNALILQDSKRAHDAEISRRWQNISPGSK